MRPTLLLALLCACAPAELQVHPPPEDPAVYATHARLPELVVPVTVFLLDSEVEPVGLQSLTEADIEPLFAELDRTWGTAAIRFEVQEVSWVQPSPEAEAELAQMWEDWLGGHDFGPGEVKPTIAALLGGPGGVPLEPTWNVAFLHSMALAHAGGVWVPSLPAAFVTETRDEQGPGALANVLAHELGHSLGLRHNELDGNLMGPGAGPTEQKSLTVDQIETARAQVESGAP